MTEEEFSAWRDDEITQAFFEWIRRSERMSYEAWEGALKGCSDSQLSLFRARIAERLILTADIINVSYEDLAGDDGEHERDSPD